MLDSLGRVLRCLGHDVVASESAEEALGRLLSGKRVPDLIIADCRVSDGRIGAGSVAQLRREFGAQVPAILLGGGRAGGPQVAASGSVMVLPKPVAPATLGAATQEVLAARTSAVF